MQNRYKLACLAILSSLPACDQATNSYFPLEPGLTRAYLIKRTIANEPVLQKQIITGLAETNINGHAVHPQKYANGAIYYYTGTPEGIKLVNPETSEEDIVLRFPLVAGTRWQQRTHIHLLDIYLPSSSDDAPPARLDSEIVLASWIESNNETVSVPAGTYTQCIKVSAAGKARVNQRLLGIRTVHVTQSEWYAPGVGLIKRIRVEATEPAEFREEYTQVLENLYTSRYE